MITYLDIIRGGVDLYAKGKFITPDELYNKLPNNQFHIDLTLDNIREYSPYMRFPTCKYDLWEVLSAWYILVQTGRVEILEDEIAVKV